MVANNAALLFEISTVPRQPVHEGPASSVDRRWPDHLKRRRMYGTWVSLVALEVERRKILVVGPHNAVARHLRQNRGRRNRERTSISFDERGRSAIADEVPVPIHEYVVGLDTQTIESSASGQTLGLRHTEEVTLFMSGMSDRP